MHEDGIIGSPERCVESHEFFLAEKILCFFFSNDKFFFYQCSPSPLKDVLVEAEVYCWVSVHLINGASRFFTYDHASKSGESGEKPFHESVGRLDRNQAIIINNTLARSGMETDKVQYGCEIRRGRILIEAWR